MPTIAASARNTYRSKGAVIVLMSIVIMVIGGIALVFCKLFIVP